MKNFIDFDELISKQSEVIYNVLCDHIGNTTSDIIAILSQSFVNDDVSFQFEKEALNKFNDESSRLQGIVEKGQGKDYNEQINNLL